MPRTEVILFKEDDKSVPLVEWLESVPKKPQAKCVAALARLEELGHELRRPEADYLRDDIHELRIRFQSVNYRMLYLLPWTDCRGRVAWLHERAGGPETRNRRGRQTKRTV